MFRIHLIKTDQIGRSDPIWKQRWALQSRVKAADRGACGKTTSRVKDSGPYCGSIERFTSSTTDAVRGDDVKRVGSARLANMYKGLQVFIDGRFGATSILLCG
jgi:hypothetical protein